VIGEIILHINQNLIVIPGTKHPTLKTVFSHPVALQQCLDFFKQRVPQATLIASDDTGGSVKDMMAKGDATRASVASSLAAKLYGAEVLDAAIQSDKQNFTRFFVIVPVESDIASVVSALVATAQDQWQTPANKTTLILQVKHQPGELARCLKIIADFETNLTRIESRPIRGRPWEYTIQLDMILTQPAILTQMMRNLDAHVIKSKTLGLYGPASVYES
jgi:prephenate dehydratase